VEPGLRLQQTIEDIYQGGDRLAKYHFRDVGAGFDFGRNIGTHTQVRLGYLYTHRSFSRDTGIGVLPEEFGDDRNDGGIAFSLTRDTRDRGFSATRGSAAVVEYTVAEDWLGGQLDWQRAEAAVAMAVPLGRNVIWTTLSGGSDFGSDLPFDRLFTLGGPGSFPGLELGEIRAEDYASLSGSYLHKLTDLMSLRGQAIYAGLRLQVAQVSGYNPLDGEKDSSILGGSLYFTGSTPVGPLTLGYGATSTDAWSVWLAIGRPVGHGTLLERGIFR
jgi:NTE family protein